MNDSRSAVQPILIVDDDPAILLSMDTTLRMAGWDHVITCEDSRNAMSLIRSQQPGIVLLDLTMPYVSGEDLLPLIRGFIDIPVIIITGAVDVNTAVRCIKAGAFDYIVKPVEEDHLLTAVKRASSFQALKQENLALKQQILSDVYEELEKPQAFKEIITQNRKMMLIFEYAESIAGSNQPVLIRGETGVGKELMARAIHKVSEVSGKFTAVNAAGLDDNVFSDTLFGHVRGAFTGADTIRRGLIEQADSGTLFLDEIGDLTPASQVKLLRLLQEGEYYPLGADQPGHANVRILAATNQDLSKLQNQGTFRKDLNYRLRTHRIHIPPLRERMDDISLLTAHFLDTTAKALNKKRPTPPDSLFTLLNTYSFPGNIRELQAMIFDAVSRHKSGILSMDSFKSHILREQAIDLPDKKASGRILTFSENLPTIKLATSHICISFCNCETSINNYL